ncbi:response regulator [Gemmatimonas aurantiaca]|nr:response regulator [Gemmatimonas aurantiaca]
MMNKQLDQNKVLIIDDTEVIRSLLTEALSDKGYSVISAPNALSGIEMATQYRPGLIFCDTYMPDLDGFETVRRIKQLLPDTVVVMTNSMMSGDSQDDADRKFDYLLNKPFSLDELWDVIKDIKAKLSSRISNIN